MYPETSPAISDGIIAIVLTSFLVFFYYWLTGSMQVAKRSRGRSGDEDTQSREILFNRILGASLFGLVPIILVLTALKQYDFKLGLSGETFERSLLYWLFSSPLIISLTWIISRRPENLSRYPQIRSGVWNAKLIILSALGWIVYLTGYELLFRGFLLFACEVSFGFWPAVLINILLYALAHIKKSRMEIAGSLPVGFVLSLVTLRLGSIWFALLAHITMALANEWISVFNNRGMRFISFKKTAR